MLSKTSFVELLLVYQNHWILAKIPKDPTVLQELQFQSNTFYFEHIFIPLFPFFLSLMLFWNKILHLESASTFLQAFFVPSLLVSRLSSSPDHSISLIQAEDASQPGGEK